MFILTPRVDASAAGKMRCSGSRVLLAVEVAVAEFSLQAKPASTSFVELQIYDKTRSFTLMHPILIEENTEKH